jgi:hypothetical protein
MLSFPMIVTLHSLVSLPILHHSVACPLPPREPRVSARPITSLSSRMLPPPCSGATSVQKCAKSAQLNPSFSTRYKLPISHLLSFEALTKCQGAFSPHRHSSFAFPTRRAHIRHAGIAANPFVSCFYFITCGHPGVGGYATHPSADSHLAPAFRSPFPAGRASNCQSQVPTPRRQGAQR